MAPRRRLPPRRREAKATTYDKQLLDLASEGDADRPELQQARKFAR